VLEPPELREALLAEGPETRGAAFPAVGEDPEMTHAASAPGRDRTRSDAEPSASKGGEALGVLAQERGELVVRFGDEMGRAGECEPGAEGAGARAADGADGGHVTPLLLSADPVMRR
jgi:hypothetical protein